MKIIKSLTIIILFSTLIYAQAIDNEEIKSISQNWASSHNLNSEIVNIICKKVDDEPLLYIVNFEKGWVMVSADESLKPILGFSFDSNYSEENEPDALKSLFESYNFVKNENLANDIKFTPEQESIKSDNFKTTYAVQEVQPLIPVTWAQTWPYNAYCPLDDEPDLPASCNGHHNTSCGPTALAQILRYWQYPVHGIGYHSYWYDRFDCTIEADFQSTYYNWDNMPVSLDFDDPEPIYTDIATLMLHAAVSVDGAWHGGGAIHQYAAAAVKYFDYSPTCEIYYRDDFTSVEWHNIFRNELDNGRPIMLVGPGHYFICDGYYGDDFYHINWGWGPGSNGFYYPLYKFGNYSSRSWALIGLEPNYQNKKLLMNDSYTADDNTVVLLHFDGDLTNQSTSSNNPNSHGTISFADNSELGLGQCLYLDNSNQSNQSYLDIADNNDLDLSGDWTIEMWFKPTSFGNTSDEKFTLLSKPGDGYYYQSNYSIYIDPTSYYFTSKALNCSFYPNEETDDYRTTIRTDKDFLELGNWYHISYIRKTSCNNIKIVIHNSDRELIHYASRATETTSQPLLNSKSLFIGSGGGFNTYFDGYIDELRISNVVREFEITSSGLTLLTPNGGEKWEQNTTQQISWEESNSNNLKIEYTTDNEQSWSEIISSTPVSTGFYNWTLPNIDSDRCKIKITDINDVNIYDKSDNVFSILPYELTLNSPNGSNYCIPGTSVLIFWKSTPVSNIKIEYTTNNGNTWTEIVASVDASLGIYNWIIPNTLSDQCKVRITDITNSLIFDESDNTFEIGEEIITSIYDIQYTTEPGADGTYPSLMKGEEVTIIGIVTATGYLGYDSNFFISSSESGPWKGINVYSADKSPAIGDEVKIIGEVTEYSGFTEVINPVVTIVSTGNPVSEPIIVKTGNLIAAANAEQYEGCLVKVENVTVTKEPDQYNQVYINDGTGECQVDDNIFNYSVSLGDQFQYIIGVVDYQHSEYSLIPRFENDFGPPPVNNPPVVSNISDQTINEGSSF
ncbi:MAG: C10 family peptidase, partial [Candidatus Marinimicrobia bacterium]|nr:C10 family peptidase [Candidatus Neomarinimicrobiota bacterium]